MLANQCLRYPVTLTDRPETAIWLTADEKRLAVERIKSERLATTKVLDKIDTRKLIAGITSPVTLATAFSFLCNNVTVQGLAFFLPTIVKTIYPERTTVMQQLFTVPPYVAGGFFTLLVPLISYKVDRRQIFIILTAPLVMVGYAMFLGTTDPKARYAATFLIASSAFPPGALTNAHISANVLSDTARSSAIGTNGRPCTRLLSRQSSRLLTFAPGQSCLGTSADSYPPGPSSLAMARTTP